MFKNKQQKSEPRRRPQAAGQEPKTKAVFSYYSAESARSSPEPGSRAATSTARRRLKRTFAGVLAVTAVALALYSLLVSDNPTVEVRQSQGEVLLEEPEVYAQAAARVIGSSPFNRNKFTFDAAGITDELKRQFPEIGRASLTLPLVGHDPVLHIQAIEPKVILLSSGGGMYVIDRNGRAQIDLAHERSRSQIASELAQYDLPTIKDESGLEIEAGQLALSASYVRFISEVAGQLRAAEVQIADMVLPTGGSELLVRARGEPYMVRFNLYGEAREQAGRYLATRTYLKDDPSQNPEEYVDVRVDNRVYYR